MFLTKKEQSHDKMPPRIISFAIIGWACAVGTYDGRNLLVSLVNVCCTLRLSPAKSFNPVEEKGDKVILLLIEVLLCDGSKEI